MKAEPQVIPELHEVIDTMKKTHVEEIPILQQKSCYNDWKFVYTSTEHENSSTKH